MENEPRVAVFSLMRDKGIKVQDFRNRINNLEYTNLRINVCEGDSTDDTYARLKEWEEQDGRFKTYKLDLGKPLYGSVEHPERFWILGTCNDCMLNDLVNDKTIDYFLYLQPDLIVPTDLIQRLIADDKDIVAGIVWGASMEGTFYDTWGYRSKDSGTGWGQFNRSWYHNNVIKGLVEVNNVGSCFLFKRKVLDAGVRFGTDLDVVGFTNSAREHGFSVWVDTEIDIVHP